MEIKVEITLEESQSLEDVTEQIQRHTNNILCVKNGKELLILKSVKKGHKKYSGLSFTDYDKVYNLHRSFDDKQKKSNIFRYDKWIFKDRINNRYYFEYKDDKFVLFKRNAIDILFPEVEFRNNVFSLEDEKGKHIFKELSCSGKILIKGEL